MKNLKMKVSLSFRDVDGVTEVYERKIIGSVPQIGGRLYFTTDEARSAAEVDVRVTQVVYHYDGQDYREPRIKVFTETVELVDEQILMLTDIGFKQAKARVLP